MQAPIDSVAHNATIEGVPVSLTALASDGTSIDFETITTDGYYDTFTKTWIPSNEDNYKIIVSFADDNSYGSSSASATISIGLAPVTVEPQPQVTVPDYTMTIIYATNAIIIAVVISAVIVGILILRKK